MKTKTVVNKLIGNGAPLVMAGLLLILAVSSPASADAFVVKWKTPVDQPTSLAMTADGSYAASVDKSGIVRFYDRIGHLIWKQQVEGATDVLIARNGQSLLVYSRLNPIHQEVHFFRKDGRRLWRHKVRGSVWAGAVSPDGTQAAVTTGQRFIYGWSK